jgi:hypothetical protein
MIERQLIGAKNFSAVRGVGRKYELARPSAFFWRVVAFTVFFAGFPMVNNDFPAKAD